MTDSAEESKGMDYEKIANTIVPKLHCEASEPRWGARFANKKLIADALRSAWEEGIKAAEQVAREYPAGDPPELEESSSVCINVSNAIADQILSLLSDSKARR